MRGRGKSIPAVTRILGVDIPPTFLPVYGPTASECGSKATCLTLADIAVNLQICSSSRPLCYAQAVAKRQDRRHDERLVHWGLMAVGYLLRVDDLGTIGLAICTA